MKNGNISMFMFIWTRLIHGSVRPISYHSTKENSQVIWIEWHQSGQSSVRRLACEEIETDRDCVISNDSE